MKKALSALLGLTLIFVSLVTNQQAATAAPKAQAIVVDVTGSPRVDGTLYANVSGQRSGTRVTYAWKINNVASGTSSSLNIPAATTGTSIQLIVQAKKSGYKDFKYTSPLIGIGEISQIKSGSITGEMLSGQTLTATCGLYVPVVGTGLGQSSCEYQWKADGFNIDGETSDTLFLTDSMIGQHISVATTVSASQLDSKTSVISRDSAVIGSMSMSADPSFSGVGLVGSALSLETSPEWNVTPDSITYQWYRSGSKIPRATNSTYVLASADWHKRITLQIKASRDNYESDITVWEVTARVLKETVKTSSSNTGYYAWDSCEYGNYESYDCWRHTSNSSWACAWNDAYYDDDYTQMNLSAKSPVGLGTVTEWRAVVTGTTSSSLVITPGSDEGMEFLDTDYMAYFDYSGTWRSQWSSTPSTNDNYFHFGIYTSTYGGFIVKSVKIEVRYIN
jgi:hypothetical protein